MGEDATRTEQSSSTIPGPINTDSSGSPAVDAQDLFVPSSTPSSPARTLAHRSSKVPTSPGSPGNQISAITVKALLDHLVGMIETVQENQRRMEKRQVDLEGTVNAVQSDLTRLTKSHASTLGGVNKLLERSRKTSGYVKEVRERLERQSGQVKRLEANHAHLLKRNHFKVLIFQEDNEVPTTLLHKDSTVDLASTSVLDEGATSQRISVYDPNYSQDEGLQTISLSSEEGERGVSPPLEENVEQAEAHEDEFPDYPNDRLEWSRADKFKRSSLKKVDSLKKAFSRSSIEKKINKIVPPERREKIIKSFTPNNPKSPTSKTSSYRVSPMTFNVKKMRNEDSEVTKDASVNATIDVPVMGGPDGQLPLAEVHNEDEKVNGMDHSTFTAEIADGEASVTDNTELENGLPSKLTEEKPTKDEPKQEAVQENHEENKENQENGDDHQAKEEQEKEDKSSPVPASSPSAAVAIEQAS